MRTLAINIPDQLNINEQEAKMILASRLYEKGELSLGQAAELAGLTKRNFMEALGDYGVSVFNYPATDLEKDVKNAKNYHL
ncbi:MAG: UPF0175 family protein [Ilyomonas sp.]